jgi:hypothetical protein
MKTRRAFLQAIALTTAAGAVLPAAAAQSTARYTATPTDNDRAYWVSILTKVSEPVLAALAEGKLKERMPVEAPFNTATNRSTVTHLEAVGRALAGIAPWLELADKPPAETAAADRLLDFAHRGLAHATDPDSPDFLNFTKGGQPLVDAAFLAHAFIRSPKRLWGGLDPAVQKRVIGCLQLTRKIKPGNSNWLLFSAMVEAFFAKVGAEWQEEPVERALAAHEKWYVGDGTYGDGPEYHWDYYNSYVIQPFLVDVVETFQPVTTKWTGLLPKVLKRAHRYAAVQERMIGPDGTYPPLGRSIVYRCGSFQVLAQIALRRDLPDGLAPAQVRGALTAVIHRTMDAPGTFDENGWLRVGLAGHQPHLAESYVSTGSLYLCSVALLPLGLPPNDPFWVDPATDWTQKKAWSGVDLKADHALNGAR